MTNPYKKGSAKADIYTVFTEAGGGEKGLKAAHKRAVKLNIKPGTVKSWSSMWLKGQTKPGTKTVDGTKPAKKRETLTPQGYEPHFRFNSRAAADKAHEATCTRNGLRPHAMHVLEQDGKFAVVPALYKPGGPVPTFEKGDIVFDILIANSKAKVIDPGPEQTVVKYMTPAAKGMTRPDQDCVINRFLVKAPDDKPKKRERVRL
jgi:hypothetical protein